MSERFDGQPWAPSMFTAPLSEQFVTDGDRLLQLVDLAWSSPEQEDFHLDEWQRALIRHALERYPDDHPKYPGQLRYRQIVISMGRQNGKSVLGAIFGLYALLLHTSGPEVFSVASTVDQANIIFKRVKHVIDNNPTLLRRYKTSGTRGIRSKIASKPGSYFVKTGKEESLQGYPLSMCLADELHLWKPETWSALVLGSSARSGVLAGITTAGDESSELLKHLYKIGKQAVTQEGDYDERFGFFLWEAPEHLPVGHPDALKAANPAIACGRMNLEQEIQVVKTMPENQARRYRHNQFVASSSSWMPVSKWMGLEKGTIPEKAKNTVIAVDRAENWTYATITATAKHEGKIYTEVIASLTNPTLERLEEICVDINRRFRPQQYVMEQSVLKDLAHRLRERGLNVEYLTTGQVQNACATAYAAISENRVIHAHDWVVNTQMPRAVAKNVGEGWRISRRDSAGEIDAVLATIMGIYGAETLKVRGPALVIA